MEPDAIEDFIKDIPNVILVGHSLGGSLTVGRRLSEAFLSEVRWILLISRKILLKEFIME